MISFIIYALFTGSYFLHLPARYPVLGEIRFDFLLMGATLLAIAVERMSFLRLGEKASTTRFFLVLMAYIIVTIPLVEWPGSVIRHGLENYLKTIFFFIFTVTVLDTERKLKAFVAIFIICQLIRVAEPAYLHFSDGYWGDIAYAQTADGLESLLRLSGAPDDVVNPNQLAWVIVSTIPFLYYILWASKGFANKLIFLAPMPVLVYALVLTGSRSGALSLMVVMILILAFSRNRLKTVLVLAAVLIPLSVFAIGRISPDLKERYMSLIDEEAVGRSTVTGRVEGVKSAFSTAANKPVIGHGLGTSKEVSANFLSGRAQIAHNLYIEILQELGAVGLAIFALFVAAALRALSEARKILATDELSKPFVHRLATATMVWMIMDLFYSFSCFGLSSWEWYLFGGIATVCLILARENVALSVSVPVRGIDSPASSVLD